MSWLIFRVWGRLIEGFLETFRFPSLASRESFDGLFGLLHPDLTLTLTSTLNSPSPFISCSSVSFLYISISLYLIPLSPFSFF